MGPNIEVCGVPDKSIWKALSVPFIFTPRFVRFKYEYTKVTESSDKTYAWSFAASKSWEIQSKALGKSIRTAPTKFLFSRDLLQFSINLNKTWFEL